jgi:succinyl-CoA synthetase alpha subunit
MQATVALLQEPEYQKKQAELLKKLEACSKGVLATMAACMEPVSKQMEELQSKVNAKADALRAAQAKKLPKGGLACTHWSLGGAAGKVEGTATCGEGVELKVMGTIRVVP